MNADLQPYPKMRESGVAWLGNVPEHWEVRRGKTVFRCIDERSETGREELLTVSSDRGIVPRNSASVTMFKAQSYVGHKLCWPGDLVINSLWAWSRGLGVARYHGIVSTAYGVYRLRRKARALPDFIHLLVRSEAFNWELRVRSRGIWISRLQLTDDSFLRAPLPLPPLSEQRAIVRFLDDANRRIRRYIRANERLIELLGEEKQAVIQQAVTGRIDVRTGQPYPAYKDSGLAWLGRVPEHWGVGQLGRVALERCDGPFGSGLKSSHYTDAGVRVVRLQNIGHGKFRNSDSVFISAEHYSTLGDHSVVPDDLLIAGLGDRNHPAGRACVAPREIGPAMVKADCFRFRLDRSHALPRFVALQLTATALDAASLSRGATRQRVNLNGTAGRRITLPPLCEQTAISRFLEATERQISGRRTTVALQIALLREYRTRLFADVVTGKLDVREAAAKLPETHPLDGSTHRANAIPTESIQRSTERDTARQGTT